MPADPNAILEAVQGLQNSYKSLETRLDEVAKATEEARKHGPWGAPHVRRGEDPFTSRGFSYMKLFGLMARRLPEEYAKVEIDLVRRLSQLYDRQGFAKELTNSLMIPFSSQLLAQTNPSEEALAREVGEVVRAGVLGYDREEVQRIRAQQWGVQRALSWQDETAGGALVGPPIMGELIDLLRPNEVLIAAGARILAMPPNGRLTYPRQTGTTTAYWVSESQAFSETAPTTGDVNLQAKKLGLLVKIPNELFRFSSVSIEQFIREDIARTIALKLDKDLLEGVGSATQPKGLINYAGINSYSSLGADTNGDTFQPNDVYRMIATVEQKNATFKAFIMRPLLYAAIANRRADAVSAGDQKGPYVFNLFREVGANMDVERLKVGNLAGYPVHKSSQLAADRVKGSGNNLVYVLGGDFSDLLIALSGAMEFMVSTQGDTPFVYDQTWFRGVSYVDSAPRREASFILCDKLLEQ